MPITKASAHGPSRGRSCPSQPGSSLKVSGRWLAAGEEHPAAVPQLSTVQAKESYRHKCPRPLPCACPQVAQWLTTNRTPFRGFVICQNPLSPRLAHSRSADMQSAQSHNEDLPNTVVSTSLARLGNPPNIEAILVTSSPKPRALPAGNASQQKYVLWRSDPNVTQKRADSRTGRVLICVLLFFFFFFKYS